MSDRFDKLRELEAKATAGEWRVERDTTLVWGGCDSDDASTYGMGYPVLDACPRFMSWSKGRPDEDEREANVAFIAEARNQVRALLDERDDYAQAATVEASEVRRAHAQIAELLEALAGLLDTCRTVNDAQQRQVVDPHEMQIAERAIARAEGGERETDHD